MADYHFHQLSPDDLEILPRGLLQAHWDVTIEIFKIGKDGGIDLRYAAGTSKIIVQVKHFVRTGLTGLMRELAKEAAKVRRLKPTRYVLVTSVPLSAVNKDAIVALIGSVPFYKKVPFSPPAAREMALGRRQLGVRRRRERVDSGDPGPGRARHC